MSKTNLVALWQAAAEDEALRDGIRSTGSFEELKSLARDRGLDLDDLDEAEVKRTIDEVMSARPTHALTEEELESVSGGGGNAGVTEELFGAYNFLLEVGVHDKFYKAWPCKW